MDNIKNIIFDLGGIFLNIDFGLTRQAFLDLGIDSFDELYKEHQDSNLFLLLETGRITPAEFHQAVVEKANVPVTYEQLVNAWNALLLDFPPERLEWLRAIGSKYKIFLFSNTNQIHYEAFKNAFLEQTGEDFDTYFIKAYYSHKMGLRKPNPESYQYILDEQHLKASETLFVDDTFKNIEGAEKVGLQTLHIVHPKTVLDTLL